MSGDWLGRGQPTRSRPWALEEQLLAPLRTPDEQEETPRLGRTVDPRHPPGAPLRDYWLCRCEGFAVEGPAGRVGVVEGLRFRSRVDQPDLLEVRTGLFRRRLWLVPTEAVESVSAARERVVLRDDPQLSDEAYEPLDHVRTGVGAGARAP